MAAAQESLSRLSDSDSDIAVVLVILQIYFILTKHTLHDLVTYTLHNHQTFY
jgi:hypothetical protein